MVPVRRMPARGDDRSQGARPPHGHGHGEPVVWHSHGLGKVQPTAWTSCVEKRPKLSVLLALGIAGGLLPDPAALALLLGALSSGKVLLGLVTVVVFSLGFAATLVVVGIVAAKVGETVLEWLASIWMFRLQIATSLLIFGMGMVLTIRAASEVAALPRLISRQRSVHRRESTTLLPLTRALAGSIPTNPVMSAYQTFPTGSTATLKGRALSRGSLKASILPSRSRPRLDRRSIPNQTDLSWGATAIPLRPALSRPISKSEHVHPCQRPIRLARNCRNHTEPSDPAATSVGRAPARGRSNVLVLPSLAEPEELVAALQSRPYGAVGSHGNAVGSAAGWLDLVAGKGAVLQPGEPSRSVANQRHPPAPSQGVPGARSGYQG